MPQLVYVELKVDSTTADRGLEGTVKLVDQIWNDITRAPFGTAIMLHCTTIPEKRENLCIARPENWHRYSAKMEKDHGDNTVQKDVVLKLQSVNNDFVACVGSLGIGKTVSVARIAVGALTQDQKIIVVGPA